MPRKSEAKEAILWAVEQATEWAFRGGWFGQHAFGIYYGAWMVSLRLKCEITEPAQWMQWIEEALAARAEVKYASAA